MTVEVSNQQQILVGGCWIMTGQWDEVRNPYDDSLIATVARADRMIVDRAVRTGYDAVRAGGFPQHKRAVVLEKASQLVSERIDELALTIASEARRESRSRRLGSRPNTVRRPLALRRSRPAS